MLMLPVLKSFMRNLLKTKSNDESACRGRAHTSVAYNSTGKHFDCISCNTTSSEASLPTFPKIAFVLLKNELLAWSRQHREAAALTIKIPRYLILSTHGNAPPSLVNILTHCDLNLGPILRQHDFLALMVRSNFNNSVCQ